MCIRDRNNDLIQNKAKLIELVNDNDFKNQVLELLAEYIARISRSCNIDSEINYKNCASLYTALELIDQHIKCLEQIKEENAIAESKKLLLESIIKEQEAENSRRRALLEEREDELRYYKGLVQMDEERIKELSVDKSSDLVEELKKNFEELEHSNQRKFKLFLMD
eukprot:TRINITY_DN24970_c0_g1_i1.p1 TRINITY_DN24970_c0_g1~~TRINITY_DN24970_c0_g1_i1.p1  ORF type:complete len:166 (+),score=40.24 TRINITY_DN24970_c0_g1_i1:67-564(+)